MPSGAELIRKIKEQVKEVDPRQVHDAVMNGNGRAPLLIDVREEHEFEESHIPGAVPRGRPAVWGAAPRGASTGKKKPPPPRHILLPEVGIEGQQKLLDAKV